MCLLFFEKICENLHSILQQPDNDVDELGDARRWNLITTHGAVLQSAVKFLHSIGTQCIT